MEQRMKTEQLLKKLKGTHTIESIASRLGVGEEKAIYYIYRLRKKGYVKTKRKSNNKRVYNISFENKLGGQSYVDYINENSPIKVWPHEDYKIYGKKIRPEEALIYAINSGKLRLILASLSLFKKVTNWSGLYSLAKKYNIKRKVGILYDLSRKLMKVRRMSKKFRNYSLPKKDEKYQYIVEGMKSDDLKQLEKKWRVYLPFNKEDLIDYKDLRKRK